MNTIERVQHWGDTHHPRWADIVRIALGIFLFYKGIDFLRNMGVISDLISAHLSYGSFFTVMLGHYIVFAHILGGIFLTLGAFTRFACIIQIPILFGAIIFVNFSHDVLRPYSGLIISILVLILLLYFLVAGNGPFAFSFDEKEEKVKK